MVSKTVKGNFDFGGLPKRTQELDRIPVQEASVGIDFVYEHIQPVNLPDDFPEIFMKKGLPSG